jgi:hypothetical protein
MVEIASRLGGSPRARPDVASSARNRNELRRKGPAGARVIRLMTRRKADLCAVRTVSTVSIAPIEGSYPPPFGDADSASSRPSTPLLRSHYRVADRLGASDCLQSRGNGPAVAPDSE